MKLNILKLSTILSLFFLFNLSIAVGKDNFQFFNLNEEYGMSVREANSVCSDLNGFIWISSRMGIIRYSEHDIRTYKLPYESVNVLTTRLTFHKPALCNRNHTILHNAYLS